MVSFLLLLIITGGIFITSNYFKEIENDPKEYYIIISIILLLFYCFISRKGLNELLKSLQSNLLLYGIVVLCMLTSIHGLLQYIGLLPSNHNAFPITGTFENPAGFAAVQAGLFPIVFSKCFDRDNGWFLHYFTITVSLLCLVSVIFSGSRTGFLALCSVIIVVLAFNNTVSKYFINNRWLWLPTLFIIISMCFYLYHVKVDSANGRLFIWGRCIELIRERPLFGYGKNGFHEYYMSAQAYYFQTHPESPFVMLADNVFHPFNEYIKLAIQYGMAGLLVAIGTLVWIIRKLLKSGKHTKIIGMSFVASLFIMCQFSYPFKYAVIWLLGFIILIPVFFDTTKEMNITKAIRIIFSFFLLFYLASTIRMMYYDMKWAEISKRALIGQVDRMLKYYESMSFLMKGNPSFLYNYAAELSASGHYKESLDVLSKCAVMWNDYKVQLLLANNYIKVNEIEKAVQSLDVAYNMIPCRFEPLFAKMVVYHNNNDTINTIRVADMIIEKPIKIYSERVFYIVERAKQIRSDYE